MAYGLMLLLIFAGVAHAAITEVGSSTSCATTTDGGETTRQCPHNAGTGTTRLLVVGLSVRSRTNFTSVTYGGEALSLLVEADQANASIGLSCEIWTLADPPAGTNTIEVIRATATSFVIGAITLSGVDLLDPFRTSVGEPGADSSLASLNISSAADDVVVDTVAKRGSTGSLSIGANQTEQWNNVSTESTASANTRGGGSTEPGAATVTMGWFLGETEMWTLCATSLQPGEAPPPSPSDDEGLIMMTVH